MKFDAKSIVIGLVLGAMLALILGAEQPIAIPLKWGLIVPSGNKVLVRDATGNAFIVDIDSGQAVRVEYDPVKTAATKVQLTLSS